METSIIWENYSAALKAFILKKVQSEELAEDLLQETFLRIHLHQSELKDVQAIKSWVFQIASNLTMDHFRKKGKILPVPEVQEVVKDSHEHSPADCLLPLIGRLPSHYQKALLLSEIEGRKQSEVAQILDISISGAKSRIQRGRKLLQKGLMDCCDYKLNKAGYLVGEIPSADDCKVCG